MKMIPFLLLFLLFNHPSSAQPLASAVELTALFALRSSLGLRSRDWPMKADPCSNWTGVACRSGRVVGLNISGLRRTRLGRLSPKFAVDGLKNLARLESFNATGFDLPGPIPAWFGPQLPASVSVLVLRSAKINGSIPYSLGQLGNLTLLDLSQNSIFDAIPPSFGTLTKLKTLCLSSNLLTGSVPAQLGDLSALVVLDLSFNSLTANLPDEFKNLQRLQELKLSHNNLSGPLPDSIWSSELQFLDVSFNNLTGTLPDMGRADPNPNVSTAVFDLSNNLYYGLVSGGFHMFLQRFGVVDLAQNYFQGTVPLDDNSRNVYFGSNCFKTVPAQRNPSDCKEFYQAKGIAYDGPLNPDSAHPPSSLSPKKETSHLWIYILGGVLGLVGLVIVVILVVVFGFMRAGVRTAGQGGIGVRAVSSSRMRPPSSSRVVSKDMVASHGDAFTYEQLLLATSEFSGTNLIKKGHSGELYQGVLESGFSVVVKKVDLSTVRHEGYAAELDLFAKASHTRLVPFFGQCSEKENEKFLVYKHMPHGDLCSALYTKPKPGEEGLTSLDWITRLKIAVGVAEALCFLHHESNPPLVHSDIQASSILLDDKFEVRLGSLSEVCAPEGDGNQNVFTRLLRRSRTLEQGMAGSPIATCAYDIYCFGKVLIELVTGKLGITRSNDPTSVEWLDHTLQCIGLYNKESVTQIIDPSLVLDEDLIQEAWATMVIAKCCLDAKPSRRPVARYVLKALENPLKVMRIYGRSNSYGMRTTSSRASWHGAFFGSWRHNSSDFALGSVPLGRSGTVRSQGSLGERSFSHKRHSTEIFPEPAVRASDEYKERQHA